MFDLNLLVISSDIMRICEYMNQNHKRRPCSSQHLLKVTVQKDISTNHQPARLRKTKCGQLQFKSSSERIPKAPFDVKLLSVIPEMVWSQTSGRLSRPEELQLSAASPHNELCTSKGGWFPIQQFPHRHEPVKTKYNTCTFNQDFFFYVIYLCYMPISMLIYTYIDIDIERYVSI